MFRSRINNVAKQPNDRSFSLLKIVVSVISFPVTGYNMLSLRCINV